MGQSQSESEYSSKSESESFKEPEFKETNAVDYTIDDRGIDNRYWDFLTEEFPKSIHAAYAIGSTRIDPLRTQSYANFQELPVGLWTHPIRNRESFRRNCTNKLFKGINTASPLEGVTAIMTPNGQIVIFLGENHLGTDLCNAPLLWAIHDFRFKFRQQFHGEEIAFLAEMKATLGVDYIKRELGMYTISDGSVIEDINIAFDGVEADIRSWMVVNGFGLYLHKIIDGKFRYEIHSEWKGMRDGVTQHKGSFDALFLHATTSIQADAQQCSTPIPTYILQLLEISNRKVTSAFRVILKQLEFHEPSDLEERGEMADGLFEKALQKINTAFREIYTWGAVAVAECVSLTKVHKLNRPLSFVVVGANHNALLATNLQPEYWKSLKVAKFHRRPSPIPIVLRNIQTSNLIGKDGLIRQKHDRTKFVTVSMLENMFGGLSSELALPSNLPEDTARAISRVHDSWKHDADNDLIGKDFATCRLAALSRDDRDQIMDCTNSWSRSRDLLQIHSDKNTGCTAAADARFAFRQTNCERVQRGLSPLKWHERNMRDQPPVSEVEVEVDDDDDEQRGPYIERPRNLEELLLITPAAAQETTKEMYNTITALRLEDQ